MTRRLWSKGLFVLALILILVGIAPPAYLYWFGSAHNFAPLSMPITLERGQVVSPWFKTDLNDTYQIDLDWPHGLDLAIDLAIDWKIEDTHGAVIQQGTFAYQDLQRANEVHLGFYKPRRGLRQRVILDIHTGVEGANAAHPTLNVGVPEEGLDMAYGLAVALPWAGIWGAGGLILLIVALALRNQVPGKQDLSHRDLRNQGS